MKKEILSKGLDVAEKTIELATKVYDDGLHKPTKTISNGLNMCLEFLGSMFSPIMYEYIQNAEYKKKEIDKKLAKKYETIPIEKRTIPRMNIMGPSIDLLKYNLDEEYIKNIFINIMTSEMNKDKQEYVLPAYIEIVKQLSKKDTEVLELLNDSYKKNKVIQFALSKLCLNIDKNKGNYKVIDNTIIVSYIDKETKKSTEFIKVAKLETITLDNLSRLGLVKIYDDKELLDEDEYTFSYDLIKKYNKIEEDTFQQRCILEITELGIKFIDICLN